MHAIRLRGARTHHLKAVDLDLLPGQLVAITGVSGAGKSSLAFDTLYSEGQRRFVESFSPYARQFLERLERPPIDSLDPVAAGIAVDRRAPIKSSRSTVATMADVEAYLSALFACDAVPVCPDCGLAAVQTDPRRAADNLLAENEGRRAIVTYPLRVAGTEQFLDARERLLGDGYRRVLIDDAVRDLDDTRPSDAMGMLDVVVDRVELTPRSRARLSASLEQAWQRSGGQATLRVFDGEESRSVVSTRGLSCTGCGRTFAPPRPGLFSYQSPVGACGSCRGFGRVLGIDMNKVIPDDSLSLAKRVIRPWSGRKATWERRMLKQFCEQHAIAMDVPWRDLDEAQRELVLQGEGRFLRRLYPGIHAWFRRLETKIYKMHVRVLLARYRSYELCVACNGKRLSELSLTYRVDGLDLGDWHALELSDARGRLGRLAVSAGQAVIAKAELAGRLGYLERVGLGYLTLNRQARTLSGGEAQRVSLTAALGSSLTGALFVLDEPTVGLHATDLPPLIDAMRELAARGNVVLVVEHDRQVIEAADRIVELGPHAGRRGGEILYDGAAATAPQRPFVGPRRLDNKRVLRGEITIHGASANNLRNASATFPLGGLVAVCGPSGSGKSTLVEDILYRAAARAGGKRDIAPPAPHEAIDGLEHINNVVLVDQSPLGRTSRGNPATYTGAWSRLRTMFAATPEAEIRGFGPGHFSFNVASGRCDACAGEGAETIEMQFLADVRLSCPACRGRRFKEEVLEVQLDGLNVAELLEMSVDDVLERYGSEGTIVRALAPVAQLGLGYLPLGQPLSTLSGGEAQRLKLARAIREAEPGTLLLLDEPSAGIHPHEVDRLLQTLDTLVERKASAVIVDHDLALIRACDWVVELGPGAGTAGGTVVFSGLPEQLSAQDTQTGQALRALTEVGKRVDPAKHAAASNAIEVRGAREHNLTGIDVAIPRHALVVVTGPSGSGKSSLAFDIVFAEGQRRFLETLTPYARQFLPVLPRPDVDSVSGLPPSVALEQRSSRAGVNSTVATVTEIAHYLRLLFAKVGVAHCPACDTAVRSSPPDTVFQRVRDRKGKLTLRAPAVQARKGNHFDVFNAAERAGIDWAIVDGKPHPTDKPPRLNQRKEHTIELIAFAGAVEALDRATFMRALSFGNGQLILAPYSNEPRSAPSARDELISTVRACPACGKAVPDVDPRWFSFNTKQGRCRSCEGSGVQGGHEALKEARPEELEPCKRCDGSRLAPIPRAVRLAGERYHEFGRRSVSNMAARVSELSFHGDEALIAEAPLAELQRRLHFVDEVGLGYLSLDRPARSLSGGEMQRLRLAAQVGAGLTGALYVLDEPTIGLHPRDTGRLLRNLRALVDTGSTVLVVEHDADTIRAADHVIDLGPSGGRGGGRVMASGPPEQVLNDANSPTAIAFARDQSEAFRARLPASDEQIELRGARANNLRIDTVSIPVGRMVVVAGVSGSGKSTLVTQVLYRAVRNKLGRVADRAGSHDGLSLSKKVARAIAVDQSPIGRTSRSVPATFLSIWDPIRRLFAATPEARSRGFGPARFSFNSTAGGRCSGCKGNGLVSHEMSFLPDVKTVCDACHGLRFEPQTLEVRYRGLSIGDVLQLTAVEAVDWFDAHRRIKRPLETLCDLGVGYLALGQPSPTLSGGEAQRLKLASELTAGRGHVPTLYVLDEPTTGLHHSDVGRLIRVLDQLVTRGDSLVIIEHHPTVIAAADHVVELGPEGGDGGGRVVAQGTPDAIRAAPTATGQVLRNLP